jgi:hypothetical protein
LATIIQTHGWTFITLDYPSVSMKGMLGRDRTASSAINESRSFSRHPLEEESLSEFRSKTVKAGDLLAEPQG